MQQPAQRHQFKNLPVPFNTYASFLDAKLAFSRLQLLIKHVEHLKLAGVVIFSFTEVDVASANALVSPCFPTGNWNCVLGSGISARYGTSAVFLADGSF